MSARPQAAVLLIGGVGLVGAALWATVAALSALDAPARAEGEVVAIEKRRAVKGGSLYTPVVRYVPAGVEAVEFEALSFTWPSPFAVGDPVVVAYDPARPEDATVVSFWTLWLLPLVMAGFGVGCLVAARSTWRSIAAAA